MGDNEGQDDRALRWRYPLAALIIVVFLGLVVYLTVRTGEIPWLVAGPLLGAGLFALMNYKIPDLRG